MKKNPQNNKEAAEMKNSWKETAKMKSYTKEMAKMRSTIRK